MPVISGTLKREDGQIFKYNFGNLIDSSYISNMKRETIRDLIDKKIVQLLDDSKSISYIQTELKGKTERFTEILRNNIPEGINPSILLSMDYDSIPSSYDRKVGYCVFYIRHCNHRIDDLGWMIKNRSNLYRYNDKKLFSLIKFRERISGREYHKYNIEDLLRTW